MSYWVPDSSNLSACRRPVRGRRVWRRRAVRRPDGGVRRRCVPGPRRGLRQVRGLGVHRRELLGLRAGRRPRYGGGRGLRGRRRRSFAERLSGGLGGGRGGNRTRLRLLADRGDRGLGLDSGHQPEHRLRGNFGALPGAPPRSPHPAILRRRRSSFCAPPCMEGLVV